MRSAHYLPNWYSLLMIAFAVILMFGFAGMWPEWLTMPLRAATGALMVIVIGFAIFLGLILAFLLLVGQRR